MKLYIYGPITGHELHIATQRFRSAQRVLQRKIYEVVNPFDVEPVCFAPCKGEGDPRHYDCFMRGDIAAMLTCHGVALLPGWEESKGARMEHSVAVMTGLVCKPLGDW